MIRPEQHITDDKGNALFHEIFVEWAVNGSKRDYGWDYVVEVFRNHQGTGLLLSAQLKSSLHTRYSADGTFISQVLEKDAADYLARQLRLPTFLFHADMVAKKLFWTAIQLDQKALKGLDNQETESLTVRIPTANVLPGGFDRFLLDLSKAQTVLVNRILMGIKPFEFAAAMASQPVERLTEVAEDMHEKAFHVEMNAAHQKHRAGDLSAAMTALKKVVEGSKASGYLEIHFNSVLQLGELEVLQLMQSDSPQALTADKRLSIAQELCSIAVRKPKYLHLFAQITRRAAEVDVAAHKTFGLLMSWTAHKKRGEDPLWLAVLSYQLQGSLTEVHQKYNRALRLARATAKSPFRWVASRPIASLALPIITLAAVLDGAELREPALVYRQSAFDLLKFSAAIATENQSMDELWSAVVQARMLEREKDGPIFSWIRSIISDWPATSEYRKSAEQLLQRTIDRMDGTEFEGDIQTTPRQIIYNFLTSSGIDPTSEPWAALVDLAVKDHDPTRVLIECRNKTVMQHPLLGDQMLVRLGLERANPKMIGCSLHRFGLVGAALDEINLQFKNRHCDSCAEKSPHPPGWNYYDELSKKMESGD